MQPAFGFIALGLPAATPLGERCESSRANHRPLNRHHFTGLPSDRDCADRHRNAYRHPHRDADTYRDASSPIVVPVMIYILDDANGERSSRAVMGSEIEEIFLRVNSIWAPAGIQFNLLGVERISVPQPLLIGMTRRDFARFYGSINRGEIALPRFAPIVGFYVRDLGGPNGINPLGSNTFFVIDSPGVLDERVTAHEIGHIFGLHHALDNRNRLMFSGTNGMALTEEEIAVARYGAEGLLAGVR